MNIKIRLTKSSLDILTYYEEYVAEGGNILEFADYYLTKNFCEDVKIEKPVVLIALCEDLVMAGEYNRIYEILNTVFSHERWTLNSFKRFMGCIEDSDVLKPYYRSIFSLHENCKNYLKSG